MSNEKQLGLLDRIQPLLLISSIVVGLILSHFLPRLAMHLLPVVTIGVFLVIYLIMLSVNLLPFFGDISVPKITPHLIERYKM